MPQSKKVSRPALPKATPPKPARTEVTDADARAVLASMNAVDPSTSPQAGKSTRRRVDKPAKATFYIPEQVAEDIAILAVRRKTSQSALATEAFEAYLAAQAGKKAG